MYKVYVTLLQSPNILNLQMKNKKNFISYTDQVNPVLNIWASANFHFQY